MKFLCFIADLPINSVRRICVPEEPPLAVYNLNGRFHATDDRCTHGEASLAEGEIEDARVIVCPFHFGSFEIASGEPVGPPCTVALEVYEVSEKEGALYLVGKKSVRSLSES